MWACKIYLNRTTGPILSKRINDEIFLLIKKFNKGRTQEKEEALLRHDTHNLPIWEGRAHTLHKSFHNTIREYNSATKTNKDFKRNAIKEWNDFNLK